MTKSSIINLPEMDDITEEMFNDETIINNIKTLLIEGASKVVDNTILRKYISKEEIKKNIEKNAQKISVKNGNIYVGDSIYENDTLIISPIFFSKPIRSVNSQNSDINEYPELLKLLETIGLTTAFADSQDKDIYPFSQTSTKYEYIKELIANYFVTSYDKKEPRDVIFAERKFKAYGVSNCLQLNMISVIACIIGEEALAEVLTSQTPEKTLEEKINAVTGKNNLGKEFITQIKNLDKRSKQLMISEAILQQDYEFFNNKIKPLIDVLKQQSKKMQFFIATSLEQNNYDIDDYINHHGKIDGLDFKFTGEDIEFIEDLSKRFHGHCNEAEEGKISFTQYFYTEVPEVKPRDNTWYIDDFSFINKVVTEINVDVAIYNSCAFGLDNSVISLINLLSEKIIPQAMKNKKLNLEPQEFEDMLQLMTYENSEINTSKKGQKQVQKIKKKINRKP